MDLVSRRVTERIARAGGQGQSRPTIVLRYLEEALPLDAERRAEFDVWMAFMAQAQAESGAGSLHEHVDAGPRRTARALRIAAAGTRRGRRAAKRAWIYAAKSSVCMR